MPFRGRHAACLLTAFIAASDAHAEAPYLFGDWNGTRSDLSRRGIDFTFAYGSQLVRNVQGGERTITRHSGQLVLGARADLDTLWGWNDTVFQLSVTERDGRSLGADAGIAPLMPIQENYGRGQTWRLSELWLSKQFLDERVLVKAGRLGVGADFSLYGCDFMNITFCGGQPGNTIYDYWQSWPISQWAALIKINVADDWTFGLGAYQINPYYAQGSSHGFSLLPDGTIGTLFPVELAWTPQLLGKPGSYKLGGWYSSADRADVYTDINGGAIGISDLSATMQAGSRGAYVMLQQQLVGNDPQAPGVTAYINVLQADHATNAVDRAFSSSVLWRGPLASRPHDMLGIGYGTTSINHRVARRQRQQHARDPDVAVQGATEQTAEIFYAIQLTPWLVVRPDLQWIHNPGGRDGERDVHVVGLKSSIAF